MGNRTFRRFAAVGAVAVVALAGGVLSEQVSSAASPGAKLSNVQTASTDNQVTYGSTLTITAPDGHKTVTKTSGIASVHRARVEAQASPTASGPTGQTLGCNLIYYFTDSNGTYSEWHGCGGSTTTWGFQMSSALCSQIVDGEVLEGGMGWSRNGVLITIAKGHYDNCIDQDHGTYLPTAKGNHISYADYFALALNNGATGDLQIYGSFTLG